MRLSDICTRSSREQQPVELRDVVVHILGRPIVGIGALIIPKRFPGKSAPNQQLQLRPVLEILVCRQSLGKAVDGLLKTVGDHRPFATKAVMFPSAESRVICVLMKRFRLVHFQSQCNLRSLHKSIIRSKFACARQIVLSRNELLEARSSHSAKCVRLVHVRHALDCFRERADRRVQLIVGRELNALSNSLFSRIAVVGERLRNQQDHSACCDSRPPIGELLGCASNRTHTPVLIRIQVAPANPALHVDTALRGYLFSPADVAAAKLEGATSRRGLAIADRKRAPRDRYTVASYRRAIARACDRAFPHPDAKL